MPTKHDYRRENLRRLFDTVGGPTALAKQLGYSNSSFLVQMAGPNPIRQITETTARRFEKQLDLLPGSLDEPVEIVTGNLVDQNELKIRQANLYRKRQGFDPLPQSLLTASPPVHAHNADLMSREQLASLVTLVGEVCEE